MLNLACPAPPSTRAARAAGPAPGGQLPAQVGLLKQVQGLKFVVLAIGPNDLGWSDFLRYCYGVADCSDQLTQGEFDYRLAAFDRVYGELLIDLNDLPGRPQIIVMTSYEAFQHRRRLRGHPGRGHPGPGPGQDRAAAARNDALNAVLTAGADKYGFPVARPGWGGSATPGARAGPGPAGARRPVPVPPDRDRFAADGVVGGPAGPAARLPLTPPSRRRATPSRAGSGRPGVAA